MKVNYVKSLQRIAIAGAVLASGVAFAAGPTVVTTQAADARPIVVAQAPVVVATPATVVVYPTIDARVRAIAAEGPEALRRFLWRTRGVYTHYFYSNYFPET